MLTIVAGWYRTGSTLAYNIVRMLCDLHNAGPIRGGRSIVDINKLLSANEIISRSDSGALKSHVWEPLQHIHSNLRVIYTTRDPYDALASLIRFRRSGQQDYDSLVASYNEHLRRDIVFTKLSVEYPKNIRVYPYESWVEHPRKMVDDIALFMGLDISFETASAIAHLTNAQSARKISEGMNRGQACSITEVRGDHVSDHWDDFGYGQAALPVSLLMRLKGQHDAESSSTDRDR